MSDVRNVLVPDGLEGERVDAAVSRLFGLSRTRVADLAAEGKVLLEGATVAKSARVSAGDRIEVTLPAVDESPTLAVVAEPVPWGGQPYSAEVTLPPLGGLWLVPEDG